MHEALILIHFSQKPLNFFVRNVNFFLSSCITPFTLLNC